MFGYVNGRIRHDCHHPELERGCEHCINEATSLGYRRCGSIARGLVWVPGMGSRNGLRLRLRLRLRLPERLTTATHRRAEFLCPSPSVPVRGLRPPERPPELGYISRRVRHDHRLPSTSEDVNIVSVYCSTRVRTRCSATLTDALRQCKGMPAVSLQVTNHD